ncbi:MAG TPA: PA2778 family cysteine peptidase [Planctomycetota bacterium]|nr:PA2778 family cysteine peptidase [Planctomycetota bacterium]HRR79535.1 PA2778 family cysteine peptidase [Planctomycetota bacterium]HRT96143.1 PA2778 family cysteine peptidase [Planctomycetota bacterium]
MVPPVPLRRALAWSLGCALVAGCGPTFKQLRQELEQGAPGAYVRGVPFVRQAHNRCGPAALASVAAFYQLPLTEEQIARETFLPSIRGTLTIDLQAFAHAHGLWCHSGSGSARDVQAWLDRGLPVVALLRLGALHGHKLHYVVLTGYHAGRDCFIAHTGYLPNRPLAGRDFERQFRAAGGWFLVACPPERVSWPLNAAGRNDLGLLFERAGRLDRARAEYERAVAAEPETPLFHFNLGNVLVQLGDRAGAERAYREAIRLRPAYADAHNNLANLLLDLGRRHEAHKVALRAIAIDGPRIAYYYDTLGRALLALENHAAAAAAFRRAVELAGKDAAVASEARLGLIEALVAAGARVEAAAEKQRLLATTADPALRRKADALVK